MLRLVSASADGPKISREYGDADSDADKQVRKVGAKPTD